MNFCQKKLGFFFYKDCFEFVVQFRDNHHLDNIETSNPRGPSCLNYALQSNAPHQTVLLFSKPLGRVKLCRPFSQACSLVCKCASPPSTSATLPQAEAARTDLPTDPLCPVPTKTFCPERAMRSLFF